MSQPEKKRGTTTFTGGHRRQKAKGKAAKKRWKRGRITFPGDSESANRQERGDAQSHEGTLFSQQEKEKNGVRVEAGDRQTARKRDNTYGGEGAQNEVLRAGPKGAKGPT